MTQKLPSYPSCRTILLPRGLPGRQPAGGGARAAGQGEKGAVPGSCRAYRSEPRRAGSLTLRRTGGAGCCAAPWHGAPSAGSAALRHGRDPPPAPRGRGLARPPSARIGSSDGGGRAGLGAGSPECRLGGGLVGLGPLRIPVPNYVRELWAAC